MPIVCPSCDKDDQVKKVSAVVSNGAAVGVFLAPTYGYDIRTLKTKKAQMLDLPPEPTASAGCLKALMCLFAIMAVLFFLLSSAMKQSGVWDYLPSLQAPPHYTKSPLVFASPWAALVLLLYTVILIKWWRAAVKRRRWKKAERHWKGLYYCGRDDLVFHPMTGESFPPQEMNRYLRVMAEGRID